MGLKERVQELCQQRGITAQQAEINLEFAKGSISKLNQNTPTSAKIQKIADYFEVPLDFLLGRPPFDCWEQINRDRQNFLRYVDEEADILDLVWGIDSENPDAVPTKDFISMLSICVETAIPNNDGSWTVTMRPSYQSKEKAPTQEDERQKTLDRLASEIREQTRMIKTAVDSSYNFYSSLKALSGLDKPIPRDIAFRPSQVEIIENEIMRLISKFLKTATPKEISDFWVQYDKIGQEFRQRMENPSETPYPTSEEIETYGEMAKNLAMQQFFSEEKPDVPALFAKESGVG